MLVVGSYDHCVRVISSVTWSVVCELKHVSSPRYRKGGSKEERDYSYSTLI